MLSPTYKLALRNHALTIVQNMRKYRRTLIMMHVSLLVRLICVFTSASDGKAHALNKTMIEKVKSIRFLKKKNV